MQVSPVEIDHRSTNHILRYLFLERLAAALGIDPQRPCFTAYARPSDELLTDGPDEAIFLPERQLVIAAQVLNDVGLRGFRGKLARMLKLDLLSLNFACPKAVVGAEVVLAAPWRSKPCSRGGLQLWLGDKGAVALVPASRLGGADTDTAARFLLDLDMFGIPADRPFTTESERADGVARAIAVVAAAPTAQPR